MKGISRTCHSRREKSRWNCSGFARQIHAETVDEEDEDGKIGQFGIAGMEGKAQAGKTERIDGSGWTEFNSPRGIEVFRLCCDSDGAGAVEEDGGIACDLHLGTAVADQLPVGSYALVEGRISPAAGGRSSG